MRSIAERLRAAWWLLVLILLTVIGIGVVLLCTRWGAGASSDSVTFIAIARNVLAGEGYSGIHGRFVTAWPPLYPLALALLGLSGPDPFAAGRWLGALLFGANILLVGLILRRCTRSAWIAPLGALLALVAVDLIEVHAMIWTEPLFFTFMLIALYLTAAYADAPRLSPLIGAAVAIALACVTRYSGLALLAAAVAVVVFMTKQRLRAKLKHAALLVAIGCLPLIGWMIRNAAVSGRVAGRQIAYHPFTLRHFQVGLRTVALWLLPEHIPATKMRTPFALGLVAVVLAAGALIVIAAVAGRRVRRLADDAPRPLAKLPAACLLFSAAFILQLLLTISFLDRIIQLNVRYMATVHLPIILVAMCVLDRFVRTFPGRRGVRVACVGVVVLFALLSANRAVWRVNWLYQDGLALSCARWRQSKLVDAVRHLDPAVRVYTNEGDVLALHTEHKIWSIPTKRVYRTGQPNAHFDEHIADMRRALERREAIVVLFHQEYPGVLPSRAELEALIPLEVLIDVPGEGAILVLRGHEPERPPDG